jgi:ferritin
MKLKEHEVEKEGMNKELYDLFIEMVQLEYNKACFLKGAKFYCWAHGLQDYSNFFKVMMDCCSHCKNDFIYHLLGRFVVIPEIKIDGIKTEYESAEEVFTEFVKKEEAFVDLLERIVTKSKELDDVNAMAFTLPMLNKVDHIACRALSAVKNDKNPLDLVRYSCEDYIKG